jgi:hypothetical protein
VFVPDPRFEVIDTMTGVEFEEALVELLEMLGFSDVHRIGGYDKGADITFVDGGVRVAVQAKRSSSAVGIDAVRQLIDGRHRYECKRGLLVTNSYFTEHAVECATEWDIELWDRANLSGYVAGEPPVVNPSVCAECGRTVTPGVTTWCLDHRSRYGGQVFCFAHQRKPTRGSSPTPMRQVSA